MRNSQDLCRAGHADLLIECSAEPSVMAGSDGNTDYLINTNVNGAVNCADFCRKCSAPMIFLSSSRVYPFDPLKNCEFRSSPKRFELKGRQKVQGLSPHGVSEDFPIDGVRSLYGGTKYAAEVILREYAHAFNLVVVINRLGVIAGPWQFGKSDQGIAAYWTLAHLFGRELKYIGFGGSGKQVRDMLHIDDLIDLIALQAQKPQRFSCSSKGVWNVGGGLERSVSLLELTDICQRVTGNVIRILPEKKDRYADIPIYITDNSKIQAESRWRPKKNVEKIIRDIHKWLISLPVPPNI